MKKGALCTCSCKKEWNGLSCNLIAIEQEIVAHFQTLEAYNVPFFQTKKQNETENLVAMHFVIPLYFVLIIKIMKSNLWKQVILYLL